MRVRFQRGGTIFCTAIFLFILTLAVFVGVFEWNGRAYAEVKVDLTYYFLVRDCDVTTAGAVAGESYLSGGAGFLLENEDAVVLACYYKEGDATLIEGTMSAKGLHVRILARSIRGFSLSGDRAKESARIEANARTVDSVSRILYDTANSLERTDISQDEARAALKGVVGSIAGLASENAGKTYALWNVELLRAERRAKELAEGILFAKDLRYLQIQLCVAVLRIADYFA